MRYRVTLLEGDGIGPEVTTAMRRVLEAAGAPIEWEVMPAGESAAKNHGSPMPDATLQSIRKNRLGLKGPLGTPKGGGYRSANVRLRQALDLYVGLRPVRSLPGIPTPYEDVDLVVLRENTEDLYAGIEHEIIAPGSAATRAHAQGLDAARRRTDRALELRAHAQPRAPARSTAATRRRWCRSPTARSSTRSGASARSTPSSRRRT